jgi:hypothetical protein
MCVISTNPLETLWKAICVQTSEAGASEAGASAMGYDPASPHFDPHTLDCTAADGTDSLDCKEHYDTTCCCRGYYTDDARETCVCSYDPESPVWEEEPGAFAGVAPEYIATVPTYRPGVYCLVPGPMPSETSVNDDMDSEDTL